MSQDASLDAITAGLRRPVWTFVLALGLTTLAAFLMWRGYDFYREPVGDRPLHDDYRILSATGVVGQGYGVVGTGLIALNLLYLVRRRLPRAPLGSLRVWLEVHVFTGLAGSLLIAFHSAFQIRNTLALVAAVALGAVVLSGLVGRYMVQLAPRATSKLLDQRLSALDELVRGTARDVRARLSEVAVTRFATTPGLVRTLATVPRWMTEGRRRRAAVLAAWPNVEAQLDPTERGLARRIVKEAGRAARDEVRAEAATNVLRVWRRVHRFFAILMLLAAAVHIGVAWHYGYRWIFSAE